MLFLLLSLYLLFIWMSVYSWSFQRFCRSLSLVLILNLSVFQSWTFLLLLLCYIVYNIVLSLCLSVLLLHCSVPLLSFSSPVKPGSSQTSDFKSNVQDAQSLVSKMLKNIPAAQKSCVKQVKKLLVPKDGHISLWLNSPVLILRLTTISSLNWTFWPLSTETQRQRH